MMKQYNNNNNNDDNNMIIIISSFFVVLILTIALKLLNWVWITPKKLEKKLRQQGLNGTSYRFLYGDIKEMFDEVLQKPIPFTNDYLNSIDPFLQQQFSKYGSICFTWIGPVPIINITQPELMREVHKKINEFQKPRMNPLVQLIVPGLISLDGEKWATHRKIIDPAFHLEKLKRMILAFHTSATELIDKWEDLLSETDGSIELDVFPDISNLTADVISRAAFGSNFEEGRTIFKLLREQTQITVRLFRSVYIPGWRFVPTKTNRQLQKVDKEIRSLVKGIIDERKKSMDLGEATKEDLLGLLMESNLKETQSRGNNNKHLAMSFDEMIEECKLFYLAGQDTTSSLIVWTMILLSKHQDWQSKAREEVVATFGTNLPNVDGVNRLKLVTMILYEVLRLYSPIRATYRKVHDKDTMLGNICVPTGVMVNVAISHLHLDSKHWGDDVHEFKPDRFSEGIVKATKGTPSYIPFLAGPRICIGQNFALLEAKVVVAMLLQRFSFELSAAYTHAPIGLISVQPQYGAHLIVCRLPHLS